MKRTDDSNAVADGGSRVEEFSFETTTSDVEVTWKERLGDFYTEFVYKPGLVAWDDRRTRIGGIILTVYILIGTVGAWFYPEPISNQVPRNLAPFQDWSAPLGSTQSGVDVLAMAIHATPSMLIMIATGGIFATAIALVIGTVAGYSGGTVDAVLTSFSDIAMTIPGLPLIMVLAVVFRPDNPVLIGILITVNYWAGLGRSIRSQVLTLREASYVEASRTMGVSTPRILFKDIIPNLMPFVLVNFANAARYVVFTSVGLYYLGILPTSVPNWGIQLNNAYKQAGALVGTSALYQLVVPMVMIMGIALSLILLAQGLDRVFNPRVRTRLAGESSSLEESDENTEVMSQ
ncbi:binding-protein-dependent transport systems inner membrane component [Haladaptatus paucihalophilus DX253]|uniref:Binding-protein-dependent transport systems inner membrane component n=1 Tax=Haladaptatus paucihalophilus DX253 TaxID=797209 RepID=E7QZC2_HALPU|nr:MULTISPECIES: ABC transporter permease [Haladaptatus]EFW90043.1 binding-protein-dependent transport systems inner membrane component [Haladaptatus paucihalophilus DX253]GKZ14476.1 peptide ABC transporter permease [Haladaptatus sp. T7]SHL03569.1 peptide/nickel transport system permease protein [Haladaptatus paucihalophilus DX253]